MEKKDELYSQDPAQITEAMRQSLARAYADADFRAYIVRTIQASNANAITALDYGKPEDARYYANRAKAMSQFLEKAKNCFVHFDKISKSGARSNNSVDLEEPKI